MSKDSIRQEFLRSSSTAGKSMKCESTKHAEKKNVIQEIKKSLEKPEKIYLYIKVFILAPQRGKSSGHSK